jgi:hypothetical protein
MIVVVLGIRQADQAGFEIDALPLKRRGFVPAQAREQEENQEIAHRLLGTAPGVFAQGIDGLKPGRELVRFDEGAPPGHAHPNTSALAASSVG